MGSHPIQKIKEPELTPLFPLDAKLVPHEVILLREPIMRVRRPLFDDHSVEPPQGLNIIVVG